MRKIVLSAAALAALFLAAFTPLTNTPGGIDMDALDRSVDPADDFYRFANGGWLRNNPIPASESRWGSFNQVSDRNNDVLKKILEEAAADRKSLPTTVKGKVGAFYRVFMDTLKRDKAGYKPVEADIKAADAIANSSDLIRLAANFHKKGISTLFRFWVNQDLKNSTAYIAYLGQGGLNLPDRDYYLKEDAKSKETREAYQTHLRGVSGKCQQPLDFPGIMGVETALAKASMTRVERRNQEKQYHKKPFSELLWLYPEVHLDIYFNTIGVEPGDSVIVQQPLFFEALNNMLVNTDINTWRNYMKWCAIDNAAGYLSKDIEKLNFNFRGTVLNGIKEQKPMWKRGIDASNGVVGEMLGQLFVERTFTPESKRRVNEMVDNIMEAFRIRIQQLDWMSEATKQKALHKLSSFTRKFGYPDKWKDHTKLEIKEDSYLANAYRASEYQFNEMTGRLGKPIDRVRWNMLPQTVNAYYNPSLNEIVFPAAIMQVPFFIPDADDAVNYGAIGAVIGHELTHGFDDQGSKYTAEGNLMSWWTEEDRKKFDAKTKVLVKQYNEFKAGDSLNVNGELTLGENIADFGGLTIAYEALKLRLQKSPLPVVNGFTPEQRFFISFAQVWKNNIRPEALRQRILTDSHSPGEFRVLGPLSNMPSFYEAFNVKPENKMWRAPEERAQIW